MGILFKLDENPNIRLKPTAGLALVSSACIFTNLMNIQLVKDMLEKSNFGQEKQSRSQKL
jgi:hypothetical protein